MIFKKKKLNLQSVHTILTMGLTGLTGHINELKLQRIRQVGISECGGWLYEQGGHINGSFM